jgi:hypothetical protein
VSSARAGKSGGRAQSKSERAALRWRRHAVARRGTRWPSGEAERGREGHGELGKARARCRKLRPYAREREHGGNA